MEHSVGVALDSTNSAYKDAAKRDILAALRDFGDLHPGQTYNIPIRLVLWDRHPYVAPLCYVRPTPEMMVKPSQFVDPSGRVYMPYLSEWTYPSHNMQTLLQLMVMTFQDNCPVFSRPAGQPAPAQPSQPAYPSYPQFPMPNPAVSSANQPLPYPSFSSQPQPPSSTHLPYPVASSGSATSLPYSSSRSSLATVSTNTNSANFSTIQPEHIRASLLSAVEDKVKIRLQDRIGMAYAELQSVRKTRQDLVEGEQKLKAMLQRLKDEEKELNQARTVLTQKKQEIERIITSAPTQDEMKIDDSIGPSTPLHRQLLRSFVEDSALEDAIYYLGQALKRGTVTLDVYMKHVRDLSRQQFMARAIMQKCRQTAGLNV